MPTGSLPAGSENSVITPEVVIRAIVSPVCVVIQRLPSDPAAIPYGRSLAGSENSVITPAGVILPIFFALRSVNHKFPSGPAVISFGTLLGVGTGYSVIVTWAAQTTAPASSRPIAHKWIFGIVGTPFKEDCSSIHECSQAQKKAATRRLIFRR
jgi:hypothetical protein